MVPESCKNQIDILFRTLLDNHPDFKEVILNLLLVCNGVRSAFLYEEANYYDQVKKEDKTELFLSFIGIINENTCLELKTYKDNSKFTRIFVYLSEISRREVNNDIYPVYQVILKNPDSVNTDIEIAKILGFICVGHKYYLQNIDRTVIRLFLINEMHPEDQKIEFKVEVCETSKFIKANAENKLKIFQQEVNNSLEKFGYFCELDISKIFSNKTRLKMLKEKNIDFLTEYLNEYINDLANYYISDDFELEKSTTYKKLIDIESTIKNKHEHKLLVDIYTKTITEKFDVFYEGADTYEKIEKVSAELSDRDIEMWKNLKYDGKSRSKGRKSRRHEINRKGRNTGVKKSYKGKSRKCPKKK